MLGVAGEDACDNLLPSASAWCRGVAVGSFNGVTAGEKAVFTDVLCSGRMGSDSGSTADSVTAGSRASGCLVRFAKGKRQVVPPGARSSAARS